MSRENRRVPYHAFFLCGVPRRVTHLFYPRRIAADAVLLAYRTRLSFPNTCDFPLQQPVRCSQQGAKRTHTRIARGLVYREKAGGVHTPRRKGGVPTRAVRAPDGGTGNQGAMSGTSASKRPERFHGAFTGGFSAGFYNSVRVAGIGSDKQS